MRSGGHCESGGGRSFQTWAVGHLLAEVDFLCRCAVMNVEAQVRLIRALRVTGSSAASGWSSAEPDLASSSPILLPFRSQWPGTHSTSRHLSALSRATATCTSLIPSSGVSGFPTASTSDLQSHMCMALHQSSCSSSHAMQLAKQSSLPGRYYPGHLLVQAIDG